MKTKVKIKLNQKIVLSLTVILSLFVFSCAKTPSGVRTVKQTNSQVINPAVSNPSVQAANNQGLLYQLTSLERPLEATDGSISVSSEIKTPGGLYVPVTTTHVNGSDAGGTINDAGSQSTLDIRARCIGSDCEKYIMLITVIRNGSAVHQIAALSNKDLDYFTLENINVSVSLQFYRSLDELAQHYGSL